MKRQPCCLTALFFFLSLAAFSQPTEIAAGGAKPPALGKIEGPGPLFRIAAEQRKGSLQAVEVQVWVDHRLALSETAHLPRDEKAVSVELLRGHPQILAALKKLENSWVAIHVVLDGITLGEFSLGEAGERSRVALSGERVIGATRLEIFADNLFAEPEGLIRELSLVTGNATACQDTCQSDYSACMAQNCPQQFYCDYCDQLKAQCLDNCICYDSPNAVRYVSYYYGSVVSSCFVVGATCLHVDWPPYQPFVHDKNWCCSSRDYYRRSVYCDGHSVVEVISTQNLGCGYCDRPTPTSCYPPSGKPYCTPLSP